MEAYFDAHHPSDENAFTKAMSIDRQNPKTPKAQTAIMEPGEPSSRTTCQRCAHGSVNITPVPDQGQVASIPVASVQQGAESELSTHLLGGPDILCLGNESQEFIDWSTLDPCSEYPNFQYSTFDDFDHLEHYTFPDLTLLNSHDMATPPENETIGDGTKKILEFLESKIARMEDRLKQLESHQMASRQALADDMRGILTEVQGSREDFKTLQGGFRQLMHALVNEGAEDGPSL